MRTLGPILLLAACGGASARPSVAPTTAPPPRPAPAAPIASPAPAIAAAAIDWSLVVDEPSALAAWLRLQPTGRDWELRVDEIPDDLAVVQAMAAAQLRHAAGDDAGAALFCASQARPMACLPDPGAYQVAPDADWGDPCLQRELALWSVVQLEAPDLADAEPMLTRLVSRPHDDDLADAVLGALDLAAPSMRLRLLMAALAAGNRAAAAANLDGLPRDGLRVLALEHHLDAAYDRLSLEDDAEAMWAGLSDEALAAETRIDAMDAVVSNVLHPPQELAADARHDRDGDGLVDLDPKVQRRRRAELVATLRRLSRDAACEVAVAADDTLAELGERDRPLLATRPRDLVGWRRAACIRNTLGLPPTPLVASRVRIVERIAPPPEFDELGDPLPPAAPYTEVEEVAGRELEEVPFDHELLADSTRCDAAGACVTANGTRLTLGTARRGGVLVLTSVERFDPGRCDAP
ncbi:MAG: hypothetical protein R2939_00920 [Kofleriaceae bacterium]